MAAKSDFNFPLLIDEGSEAIKAWGVLNEKQGSVPHPTVAVVDTQLVDSGETNPCSADSDGDGIQDGVELGIVTPIADPDGAGPMEGTDTAVFIADADPTTTTDPTNPDTDGDGYSDGAEDLNFNGQLDAGESDPNSEASRPRSVQVPLPLWSLLLLALLLGGIGMRSWRSNRV
jgi:hypothetical protein